MGQKSPLDLTKLLNVPSLIESGMDCESGTMFGIPCLVIKEVRLNAFKDSANAAFIDRMARTFLVKLFQNGREMIIGPRSLVNRVNVARAASHIEMSADLATVLDYVDRSEIPVSIYNKLRAGYNMLVKVAIMPGQGVSEIRDLAPAERKESVRQSILHLFTILDKQNDA